jgi:ABC-type multidrug transport system fused ATPase/permease subunit
VIFSITASAKPFGLSKPGSWHLPGFTDRSFNVKSWAVVSISLSNYYVKTSEFFMKLVKKILFSDVTSLVRLGRTRPLESEDMPSLPDFHNRLKVSKIFETLKPIEVRPGEKASRGAVFRFLIDVVWRVKGAVAGMVLLSLGLVVCDLLGPVLINRLLNLFATPSPSWGFIERASGLAIAFGLCGAIGGILGQHYIYRFLAIGMMVNAGLNERIYETSLKLSKKSRQVYPTGDVVNYMGSDTDSVQDFVWAINELFMAVISIIGASVLMVYFLGNAGYLAVLVLVLLVPPTKWIAKKFCFHSDEVSSQRDKRAAYMSQVLSSIRIAKSFGWEQLIVSKIGDIRDKELGHRKKFIKASGLSVVLYGSIGTIVGGVVLGAMSYLGEPLTAAKLFTALSLIAVMETPFGHLTHIISMITDAFVSGERIGKFLGAETRSAGTPESAPVDDAVGLEFDDGALQFSDADTPVLSGLRFRVEPGTSLAIVGPVGSGKSAILGGILREVSLASGRVAFFGRDALVQDARIAYVPQEAFIQNASLRQNILFGAPDLNLSEALKASCLDADVKLFSAGINTEIGEHGVNLSGGQKQRVALARAVIQRPSVVLLDDPLSALDEKTEQKIIDGLIFGLWAQKTRVVVTHRLKYIGRFDQILFLENGTVAAIGSLEELLDKSDRFREFYSQADITENPTQEKSSDHIGTDSGATGLATVEAPEEIFADKDLARITENEDRQYGSVSKDHYALYLRSMWSNLSGRQSKIFPVMALFALAMLAATGMPILVNAWMGVWGDTLDQAASVNGSHGVSSLSSLFFGMVSPSQGENIGIYMGLAAASACVAWGQYMLYGLGGVRAGKNFHDRMLQSVLGAKIRFFDSTPVGRVLNRFSKDLDTIERHLPWSFEQSIRSLFGMIGQLVLISTLLPLTVIVTIPVLALYYTLQRDYRMSSREAQRLYSVSRSPRYSHFKETLTGLTVIRAFKREDYFRKEFFSRISMNQRMFHGMVLLNRWFSLRVALTAAAISIAVSLASVWSVAHGYIMAGTAGLAMMYGVRFWETLNWAVRIFSQLESQMTCVERVARFSSIPQESSVESHSEDVTDKKPGASPGPRGLDVIFDQVSMRYADHLPLILRGLSFSIRAGQRVGIIGKTGAGKSSVFHALYRFSELTEGRILIGGRSQTAMRISELRSLISTVPQDPVLFMGDLRGNCDPFDLYSDDEIWSALERVQLADRVRSLSNGLKSVVSEGGCNFSQGERQLICLARALLSEAPIILMDEATSAIDVETDVRIQTTIRREFLGRTILIIAHRLATIADCDQIIEIKDGRAIGPSSIDHNLKVSQIASDDCLVL